MPLKVIGAGLGRTGTASLKVAIERLGIGRCYHMGEMIAHIEHAAMWINASRGEADWDALLADYAATVDYPACNFWQELAERYPEAKILLSVRDANQWFESTQETIFAPHFVEHMRNGPFKELGERVVWSEFQGRMHDRDFMVPYFENRIEEIKRSVPAERLLVYEVKQGWEPLCEFLDVRVPEEPFPRVNARDDTVRLIEAMMSDSNENLSQERLREIGSALFDSRSESS